MFNKIWVTLYLKIRYKVEDSFRAVKNVLIVGWAIATEEREWKYRLSVYYTKPQDSGTFTCATPRGITNSITLHVTGIFLNAYVINKSILISIT